MTPSRKYCRRTRRCRVLLALLLGVLAAPPARAEEPGALPVAVEPAGVAPPAAALSAVPPATGTDSATAPPPQSAAPPTPDRLAEGAADAPATAADGQPTVPSSLPPEASPPPPATSLKAVTEMGVRLYEQGDFPGAIQAFTLGYSLRPKPLFLFNIAQAYRKSGHDKTALEFYEKFIRIDPKSPYRAEADAYIALLRGRLRLDVAPPRPPPLYRKGWFWGVFTSSTVVAGIAVTLGIVLGTRDPTTTLGTVEPRFR